MPFCVSFPYKYKAVSRTILMLILAFKKLIYVSKRPNSSLSFFHLLVFVSFCQLIEQRVKGKRPAVDFSLPDNGEG